MKYWSGYITAAVIGAITWALMQLGARFTVLVDMVYPYVTRTMQTILAQWSGGADFCLWQAFAIGFGVIVIATLVVLIICRGSFVRWLGWVLAACSLVLMLHTVVYGLNFYAGPIAEDVRLESVDYDTEDLTAAAIYYRDKANDLSGQIGRDSSGNPDISDFKTLAAQAGDGFKTLVYEDHYPIFAGSREPVKELGWADFFTKRGITGVTMGLTGEAAVNPRIPAVALPFTMCHEMAHRMCIAREADADFAAFLACQRNESPEFQYSGYLMAYRYCYMALAGGNTQESAGAAARVAEGASAQVRQDLQNYDSFFSAGKNLAPAARDGRVCDLLVAWHYQQEILPTIVEEESPFDPYDETQVDLSGIAHARPGIVEGVG